MNATNQLTEKMFTFLRSIKEQLSLQNDMMHLSMIQLHTLIFIKQHPGTPMKTVAEYLKVELPSATTIVEKLVNFAFITRHTDKDDRRLVLLSLTPKGKSMLEEAMKERAKNMEKVLSSLSEEEKEHLSKIFDTLIMAMETSHEK